MSGSCVIDYGTASILPSLTLNIANALSFHSLNHANEIIAPYYYGVNLTESCLWAEVVSQNAAGILRISPNSDHACIDVPFYYVLILGSDTMYNKSSVEIVGEDVVHLSSPIHRWYQSKGQYAGYSGHHYFKFSRKAIETGIIDGYSGNVHPGARIGVSGSDGPVAAYLRFKRKDGDIFVSTGCSFISVQKAHDNMFAELLFQRPTVQDSVYNDIFDIKRVSNTVKEEWNARLGMIEISDSETQELCENDANTITFYSAMWHSFLLPRIISDHDGEFLNFNEHLRSVENTLHFSKTLKFSRYYDDFSMWDIYRAQLPLLILLSNPEDIKDMVASLVTKSLQGGWMPIFPAWNTYTSEMIGDHAAVFIADAVFKGALLSDDPLVSVAFHAIIRNALEFPSDDEYKEGKGRRALGSYIKYGFIPFEDTVQESPHPLQQVSRTLEYAYNDFVLSQLAKFLDSKDTSNQVGEKFLTIQNITMSYELISKTLLERSKNFKNVIDGDGVGFIRARHANLSWVGADIEFDPSIHYSWITETDSWQYTWFVPHDVEGMIDVYGGQDAFITKLNHFFDDGWYNHGNEPDHHAAYLYAFLPEGNPRLQKIVHTILNSQYGPKAQDLSGNEDAGQMSAWFVMSAIGLYPVCPGCGGQSEYTIGMPLFNHIVVFLPTFTKGDFSSQSRRRQSEHTTIDHRKRVTIHVSGREDPSKDIYIQQLFVNKREFDCSFISHSLLVRGNTLMEFFVGAKPNTTRARSGRACLEHNLHT